VRGLKLIAGTAAMYDLTVSNVHTFAVGDGQFVVHNCPQVGDGGNEIKLSPKVNQAIKQLDAGATKVTVSSRSEAEELFLRRYQGEGYANTTDLTGTEVKNLFGSKAGTYHWDITMDPNNYGRVLGHALDNPDGALPHLQIHPFGGGPNIHIFFPWET